MMLADVAAGSQEAFNNAIWQYPVAALLLLVVGMFLRHQIGRASCRERV